jgi:putative SOS response-associated peptidase YedK
MIITEPNKFVAEVHDRMPILLAERDLGPWLRGAAGAEPLKPATDDLLQRWPVSKRVLIVFRFEARQILRPTRGSH